MSPSNSIQSAIDQCMDTRTFSLTYFRRDERPLDMHLHDCYEIYYALSGGCQFLIDDQLYDIGPGDLFFVDMYQSHHILCSDTEEPERIVIFIHPEYVEALSSQDTPLNAYLRKGDIHVRNKYSLSEEEERLLRYHINQLKSVNGFGSDVLLRCRMTELLIFLYTVITGNAHPSVPLSRGLVSEHRHTPQVQSALNYINDHISEDISLSEIADHLFLSESYLCRIFKACTGTTISKYIVGRRIAIAKALLSAGYSVAESQERCGFNDYSNFLKAFTRSVGMSPKKYAQVAHSSPVAEKNMALNHITDP